MRPSPNRDDARSAARPWTPEEAAEFAARRDFRLLQLLSTDRGALRAARRLGVFAVRARRGTHEHADAKNPGKSRQQRGQGRAKTPPPNMPAPLLNSAQRRSARRREEWWQAKLATISAGTEASHTRSTSMVREMQGLIQEMRHAGAVPGESPALALLDVSMVEAEAAASTCGPAESAVVAAVAGGYGILLSTHIQKHAHSSVLFCCRPISARALAGAPRSRATAAAHTSPITPLHPCHPCLRT